MPEKLLSDRLLAVAIRGHVPPDDPHVIADVQAELDRLRAENEKLRAMIKSPRQE